jgi:saccharopine dehydrogenase-like NADP-dependent oxidoreductase
MLVEVVHFGSPAQGIGDLSNIPLKYAELPIDTCLALAEPDSHNQEAPMRRIAVVGAGKIGSTVVDLLTAFGSYEVLVIDASAPALAALSPHPRVETAALAIDDAARLAERLEGRFAVVNCAPFHLTVAVARAAAAAGAHYLDLTEDVAASRVTRELAETSKTAFIPQCGLAPGFITIAAWELAKHFDELHDVRLRVGALPRYPSNALNYNLTWSTDGVINEYCEPCEAIVNGRLREVPALEECEEFALDGVTYEAFNTSGGLGGLCQSLDGQVRNLNYKTIRYPGHAAIMKALLNDLDLRNRRPMLKDILEKAVPATLQDVVIVFVTVSGLKQGRLVQETYVNKVFAQVVGGQMKSAIQITTAGAVCAVLDMLAEGRLPQQGFIRQEDIALADFLANRFGRFYAPDDAVPFRAAAE